MTERAQILADLLGLHRTLGRPVCSDDLKELYRDQPDRRPVIFHRLGQCLIRLARPLRKTRAPIVQIGVIANRAFYAPSLTSSEVAAFERYRTVGRMTEAVQFAFPEHALAALGTKFDGLVRNALAGFVEEFEEMFSRYGSDVPIDGMATLLAVARRERSGSFVRVPPANLFSRAEADELLRAEYQRRMPGSEGSAMNTGRHLVHLQWPQSEQFEKPSVQSYWAEQVRVYCASRWPVTTSELRIARAVSLAMAYGSSS